MDTDPQETSKARAVFGGIMLLVGGWGGLALAGLILGFDYLLHGEPSERDHLAQQHAERRRERHADALAWLEADRADRARTRKAVRDWFAADPETRGDKPSRGESLGRALARTWNNLRVGGHRFRRGWQQGRDEARQRREDGDGQWWRTPRPNPEDPGTTAPEPPDQLSSEPGAPKGWTTTWRCPRCDREMTAPADQQLSAEDRLCPACRGRRTDPQQQDPNEPVDAEIVPDVSVPEREVVPVGIDEPGAEPSAEGYRERLDDLHGEVAQTRDTRSDHPSPPLSALH